MIMQVNSDRPSPDAKMARLRQIPVDKIKKFPAVVVDCTIGELSDKNKARAIYILGSTLVKVRQETEKLVQQFQLVESNLKKIIEKADHQDVNQGEFLDMLKEAISPEHLKKQIEDMEKAHLEAMKSKDNQPNLKDEKVQTPKSV